MEKMRYPLRQLFWECTLRCNLECRHCGSDCKKTADVADMPWEHFAPVLDEVKGNQPGVKCIVLTLGGEPLVRPDIVECGRRITEKGFFWGMVSNAMLIDKQMMRELSRNGLCSLSIDLDGMPQHHNWLRRSETSFDRAYSSIRCIMDAPHLVWDIITCVNQRNLPYLDELKRLLIEAGVKNWRCFTIVPMGRAATDDELILTDSQLRELMEFIVRTREEGRIALSYGCEGYLGAYEGKVRDYPFRCQAGFNTASVMSNGDISGCLSIRSAYTQGNIYRDSFWEVWSSRFDKYRNHEWMRTGECSACEVFSQCKGNGMHLRNDDGSLIMCHYNRLFKNKSI